MLTYKKRGQKKISGNRVNTYLKSKNKGATTDYQLFNLFRRGKNGQFS